MQLVKQVKEKVHLFLIYNETQKNESIYSLQLVVLMDHLIENDN